MLFDDEEPDEDEELVDGVLVDPDDELDEVPLLEDLLSELLLLAAGALPDDDPRLSVR